jgi:hypothetical protein
MIHRTQASDVEYEPHEDIGTGEVVYKVGDESSSQASAIFYVSLRPSLSIRIIGLSRLQPVVPVSI